MQLLCARPLYLGCRRAPAWNAINLPVMEGARPRCSFDCRRAVLRLSRALLMALFFVPLLTHRSSAPQWFGVSLTVHRPVGGALIPWSTSAGSAARVCLRSRLISGNCDYGASRLPLVIIVCLLRAGAEPRQP